MLFVYKVLWMHEKAVSRAVGGVRHKGKEDEPFICKYPKNSCK